MRHLLILVAALMFVTVAFTVPVQAQQRRVQKQQRAHQQPRAFSKHFKDRANWNRTRAQARYRANTGRRSAVNPRFYSSNGASRVSQRLRHNHQRYAPARARANVSPRRAQPRFYNKQSAARASTRIRSAQVRAQRIRNQAAARRATARRAQPTFWK